MIENIKIILTYIVIIPKLLHKIASNLTSEVKMYPTIKMRCQILAIITELFKINEKSFCVLKYLKCYSNLSKKRIICFV